MNELFDVRRRMLEIVAPALVLGLLAYFGYHVVQGDNGLLSYLRLKQELAAQETTVADVTATRQALAHRVRLMRPSSIDPDILDEQVRATLGFARTDEVIILLDDDAPSMP